MSNKELQKWLASEAYANTDSTENAQDTVSRRQVLASTGAATTALGLGTGFGTMPVTAETTSGEITIDGSKGGRTFDGVGAVSAGASSRLLYDYPEPERSQILDYIFKPGYGAELGLLKVEIGGDMNSTTGSEPSHMRKPGEVNCDRGYEWWLMKEAKKRNPDIKLAALEWGAPGWFDGGFWSQDNIDYLMAWLDCAEEHALDIEYIGGGNERGYDADWFVKLDEALQEHHPDVEILAPDLVHSSDNWSPRQDMEENPAFKEAIDVVGLHSPNGDRRTAHYKNCSLSDDVTTLEKPLWASEYSSFSHDVGAVPIARALNRSYIECQITGQMLWSPVSSWYANLPIADTGPLLAEWPWSGYYEVGKSIWSLAHTNQFATSGWRYIDTASGYLDSGASYVSLQSPEGDEFSTIIETMDVAGPTTVDFNVTGGLPSDAVHLWSTDLDSEDDADYFVKEKTIEPEDGTFSATLQPNRVYTLSTTTGQQKGDARPDADLHEEMDIPYKEDFDQLETVELAPYFSDLNGGFQAEPCGGDRNGMCYEQVVSTEPFPWHGPDIPPTTVLGDPRWWGDYQVSADVMLKEPGSIELLGRVDSVPDDTLVSGYHLQVADDGAWKLYSTNVAGSETELASGTVSFSVGSWHKLALQFKGNTIKVIIDDTKVTTAHDNHHRTGQVGLRTNGWNRAQFDNVKVTPTGPTPKFAPHTNMTASATTAHTENALGYTYPASNAIDGRPETYWRSEWDPLASLPQSITIDLGSSRNVRALTYSPALMGNWAMDWSSMNQPSPITDYAIHVSKDGSDFEEIASGTWPDSLAATKIASWDENYEARYVRLEATGHSLGCERSITASEINISTTSIQDPTPDNLVSGLEQLVPQSQISASATSWHEGFEASKAIDGDCSSMWHTQFRPNNPPLPQSITLDLGESYDVQGLIYLPRQDGNENGIASEYRLYVSSDGENFTEVTSGNWPVTTTAKTVTLSEPHQARYVRLQVVEASGSADFASAAEINVAHAPNTDD